MAESWRELRAGTPRALTHAGVVPAEAQTRFIVEQASGYAADEWLQIENDKPPAKAEAHLRAIVARRVAGEPLQYALGAWSFRGLDLLVDARVLIPRPETEYVVEIALDEAA